MKQNILMTSALAVLLTTSTSLFAMDESGDKDSKAVAKQQPAAISLVDATQPRFSKLNFLWFLWGSEAPSGGVINQGFTSTFTSHDSVELSSAQTARLWFTPEPLAGDAPQDLKGGAQASPWTLNAGDKLSIDFLAEDTEGEIELALVSANPIKQLAMVEVKNGSNSLTYTNPVDGTEIQVTPDIVGKGPTKLKLSKFQLKISK